MKRKTLINISKKTFINVSILLVGLLLFSIIMTFIVPKGDFGLLPDGSVNYLEYIPRSNQSGISLVKGLFAPVLVFFSSDGASLIALSLFLFFISAAFQVMNDTGGIRSIVDVVAHRFRERRTLLLVLVSLLFYCFGSFLGLFEEMLTMLPIVTSLCLSVGLDSFSGFLCCTIACGFGFAGAVTNPFTVLLASQIIGANPIENIWFRLLIFAVMFGVLMLFVFRHVRKIGKDPSSSPTYEHDLEIAASNLADGTNEEMENESRIRKTYCVFLLTALVLIIAVSLLPSVRGLAVVILASYFLIFGIIAGIIACGKPRKVLRSFLSGILGALPTLAFIAFAASVKFVFEEGGILPTIVHQINVMIDGHSLVTVALSIYLIVLVLEFFISSSTAKAILVMGLLAMVNTGLSRQMLVLLYTLGDGYTNVIFPTSPVLLISLSMIEVDYFKWMKRGLPLFIATFILVLSFIVLGIGAGY